MFKLGYFKLVLKPSLSKLHVWIDRICRMDNEHTVILTKRSLPKRELVGKAIESVWKKRICAF